MTKLPFLTEKQVLEELSNSVVSFSVDSGAIIGANSKKGNTETRWIGTLLYTDKQGGTVETNFIAQGFTGEYRKKNKYLLYIIILK